MSGMFPHTVTVYNFAEDEETSEGVFNVTVLKGVFLDVSAGAGADKSGMKSEGTARLFIPFSVKAEDAFTGAAKTYAKPKEYKRLEDKRGYWTLSPNGESSAADCWFIKGEVTEPDGYGKLRDRFDDVYRVAAVAARDFGAPELQHWEVSGVS